ncbi:hypothetical protein [Polaribacter ponticola]|uniref:Uncharacterized protein n=1 Tax=Polaribacter ponticola TaxID=2978475 RepID=A0ABT5SBI1_9FLAO|nr:hypothetical protein [Polaribacter sp. MSW5]MDD7915476.1 hypothetical protein [Polaribacter sp. MSW5]
MADNNEDMIIHLMQTVSDKMEDLSSIIDSGFKKANKPPQKDERIDSVSKSIEILKIEISENKEQFFKAQNAYHNQLKNTLKNYKHTSPQITNNEYVLFGKDTPFTSRKLVVVILLLTLTLNAMKYVPDYINDRSDLKLEHNAYQNFYDYMFLLQIKNKNDLANEFTNLLSKFRNNDPAILKQLNELKKEHVKQVRKLSLEKELKSLQ